MIYFILGSHLLSTVIVNFLIYSLLVKLILAFIQVTFKLVLKLNHILIVIFDINMLIRSLWVLLSV